MLTWWLNGHDYSAKTHHQTKVDETKVSDNNNIKTNGRVHKDFDKGLIGLNPNAQKRESARSTSARSQRSGVTIGLVPDTKDIDVDEILDDSSNRGQSLTPVELPGHLT